jgi:hypothetical protein
MVTYIYKTDVEHSNHPRVADDMVLGSLTAERPEIAMTLGLVREQARKEKRNDHPRAAGNTDSTLH